MWGVKKRLKILTNVCKKKEKGERKKKVNRKKYQM